MVKMSLIVPMQTGMVLFGIILSDLSAFTPICKGQCQLF